MYAEGGIRLAPVAATGEETADAPEGVGDRDTARHDGEDPEQVKIHAFPQEEIDDEEEAGAADEPGDDGNSAADAEPCGGIFNIVQRRLHERGGTEADDDRENAVIKGEVDQFRLDAETFRVQVQHEKAGENTEGNHDAVHMDIPEQCVR